MPFEIQFDFLPGGYAAENGRAGEQLPVIVREFTSSEDGNLFVGRLEGLPRDVIAKLPGAGFNLEATVDHLLAIIRPDRTATVYLNDLPYTLLGRAKRAVNAGDPVTLDHILDVTKIKLNGITVPPEAGVLAILSAGWRKGFYFDLAPLHGGRTPRTYDLESVLGQYYAYLNFQHFFSLSDAVWEAFFRQGWFPFIHLRQATLRTMIEWAKAGFALDERLGEISAEVKETVAAQLPSWKTRPLFADHHGLIAAAYRKFVEEDFVSATAILFPRIEGVLRTHHFAAPAPANASQGNLVASIFARAELPGHGYSLLLPVRFRRYLEEVFFASFDPANPVDLNRNTVAHGVAPQSGYDRKAATVGFLILLQLVSLLPAEDGRAAAAS
jgi:hypothetical protein